MYLLLEILKCKQCALVKSTKPIGRLSQPEYVNEPFEGISVDLIGPVYDGLDQKYILVIIDLFCRFTELVAINNKESITTTKALDLNWFCKF